MMGRRNHLSIIVLAVACTFGQAPVCGSATAAEWLTISNFVLIDGTGAPARPVATLHARDGVITHVGKRSPLTTSPQDVLTSVDLDGAFVMPGLIDTHVHVARFPDTRSRAQQILASGLRGGVTSVRDVGGDSRALSDIQRAAISREIVAPTVVFSAVFGGPTLFADPRIVAVSTGYEPGKAPWARAVESATDLSLVVAEARGAGAAGIKIYGNVDTDLMARLAAEARRQRLGVWAHATVFPAGPEALVDAGVKVLSHAPYLVWAAIDQIPDDYSARTAGPWKDVAVDHPRIVALLEKMASHRVYLDATLFVFKQMHTYSPQVQADWANEAFEWGAAVTALAHKIGVPVTVGTDWFEPANEFAPPNTHQELQILVEHAGLSPLEAIVAGTRDGAAALGILDSHGTVEVGKAADLVVLDEDPNDDITRTASSLRLVVKAGRLVRPVR